MAPLYPTDKGPMNTVHSTLLTNALAWCVLLMLIGPGSLTAQSTCADLTIHSVRYAAFNDTVIEVVAQAAPGSFFSYPMFSLVNAENDTLTYEEVDVFGIGQGPQTHSSVLIAGHTLPTSPFNGTLVLSYSGPGEETFCAFPLSGSLCPPGPCVDMEVFVHRPPTAPLLTTSFPWSVLDEGNATLASGTFQMDAVAQQLDVRDLCLPPGHYTLYVEQDGTLGDLFTVGVTQRNFSAFGPTGELTAGGSVSVPFTLQALCIAGTNGIKENPFKAPTLTLKDRSLVIHNEMGDPLGSIEILDPTGRCVRRGASTSSSLAFDLGALACGMHIVRAANITSTWKAQRIILY